MIPSMCMPSAWAPGVYARVQPEVGRAIDVSALEDLDVIHALNLAEDREPKLLREASGDVPPGAMFLLLERFLRIFEASRGLPFAIGSE